ncbi:MAG: pyridoxamine 5'-phosphate oxidase family protein [Verrucomicrobiaceae bacterium]|nr:pyridoxamine 5'-phosphate oxidase family protein [Verrucomicrobiaceae bacterium]NCF93095.1 pyridoxamine 5'-phosphate oxidase family protein [Verrucomicrobiaceae bacterium]
MSKDSFTPEALLQVAQETIAAAKFPQLATMDGDQPRVRPVSPVKVDGFTVFVANLRSYGKTAQISANAKVELCYLSSTHDQVRITGVAKEETDVQVLDELWQSNPLLRKYLGSQDNPELIIYRIDPKSVRFMREWALQYDDVPLD